MKLKREPVVSAFTLVELLVVVAIIAILISLLMPALAGVRERARMIKCWNGMRQIGVWTYSFADDNNGRFPGGGSVTNGSQSWVDVLNYRHANPKIQRFGQTPKKGFIYCPDMKPWGTGRYPRAYMMNRDANGGYPSDKYGLVVTNNPSRYLPGALTYYFGAKVDRVPRSQMYLFIENERSSDVFASHGIGPIPLGTDPDNPPWSGPNGVYAFRHRRPGGKGIVGNFIFMDLHVESLPPDAPDIWAASRVVF